MKKMMAFLIVLGLLFFGCTETSGQCPSERSEVCGSDGVTYTNDCYARNAGATVAYLGACTTPQQGEGGTPVSANCVDSDNGKNALELGTTTKGTESFSDSCSPASNAVFEYYCSSNAITSESVPCPAGTECNAGKCGEVLCSDTDGGQDTSVKGTVKKGSDSGTDNCSSYSNVLEYYCSNNKILSKEIACGNGKSCENGACVASACTDTDGGFNLYEKGSTKGTSGITYVDVCSGGNGITEYYCSDGNVFHTTTDCGDMYLCTNGICVEAKCKDSDSGQDEYTYGTVISGGSEYEDYCYDEDTVGEYYCSGADARSIKITCDTDELCVDGECTTDYCYDSDGGKDKDEYGTVEFDDDEWSDSCYDIDTVKEYYCSGGEEAHTNLNCDSGEVCVGGECIDEDDACSDTDGGKDYDEYGEVSYSSHTYEDYCVNLDDLKEYYCSAGEMKYVTYDCVGSGGFSGCWEGECSETMPI